VSAVGTAKVAARTRDRRPLRARGVVAGGAAGPDGGPDAADRGATAAIRRPAAVRRGLRNLKSLPQPKALQ
jgi:hypothetical protein